MTTVYDKTSTLAGTDDGDGDNGYNWRLVFKAAGLTSAVGSQVRLSLLWGSGSGVNTSGVSKIYFGQAAATGHAYDFKGNQVQILQVGGGATYNSSAGGQITTDWITLGEAWDNTKNYVCSFYTPAAATNNLTWSIGGDANTDLYYDGAADFAATSVVTMGGLLGSNVIFVKKIEFQAAAAGASSPIPRRPLRFFRKAA